MKHPKQLIMFCTALLLIVMPGISYATICSKTVNPNAYYSETKLNQDLATYLVATDGQTFTICFNQTKALIVSQTLVLEATPTKPYVIDGLQIAAKQSFTGPLLTLSGSNITLDHVILTGTPPATGQAGIGTAIQVTGTAAIESAAISDFATGINVAKDASALVTKGTFTNVVTPIAYEIPAFAGMTGEGIISADWLGKHVNDADANKIDRIAGKLDLTCPSEIPACAGMTSCGGSVEMYWKETDDNVTLKLFYPLQYHTTCPVAELKDDTLELTAADGTKKEIAIGACYFDCDGLTDVLKDNYVSFAYATAAGSTAEFMPLPAVKISELGDVINTPMIPILAPTTSGMDGADSTTTVYVPGIESGAGSDNQVDASSVDSNESDDSNTDYANFDPNAPLKEKEEVEIEDLKNDDDLKTQQGGTLSQGATGVAAVTGGCSLIR